MDDARPTTRSADIATYVTLAVTVGALVYPIGFIQLMARIWFGTNTDFYTAWLAASFVPVTDVVGQSFTALINFIPALIILSIAGIVIRWRAGVFPSATNSDFLKLLLAMLPRWWFIGSLTGLLILVLVGALVEGTWLAGAAGITTILAGLISFFVYGTRHTRGGLVNGLIVIAALYVAMAVVTVGYASSLREPTLPHVDVGSYHGWFLAHSDGYWYVLTRSGDVVAVPDGQTTVLIRP